MGRVSECEALCLSKESLNQPHGSHHYTLLIHSMVSIMARMQILERTTDNIKSWYSYYVIILKSYLPFETAVPPGKPGGTPVSGKIIK